MGKNYTIQIEKIGRKWVHIKIQSNKGYWYKGQASINKYTKHFELGEIYKVCGVLENKGNSYGSKFELRILGLHESEMQRYWLATEGVEYLKEQERIAIENIRDFAKSKLFSTIYVEKLKILGVFEKYQKEIIQYELESRKEKERKRLETQERMRIAAKEKEIRDAEVRRKTEENIKQRKEEEHRLSEEKRRKEELRNQEESLIQFNAPQKYEIGKVLYRQGKALEVVKNKWADAELHDELYWEMNYGQAYFYIVFCEDVSNTVEGQKVIKKGREEEDRVMMRKGFNSLLKEIHKYMKDSGNSIKEDDIKGKEIFRIKKGWINDITSITVDTSNNKVYYYSEIGSGGLDWSWDGKTILVVDLTVKLKAKLDKLISLKMKLGL